MSYHGDSLRHPTIRGKEDDNEKEKNLLEPEESLLIIKIPSP